MGAEATLGCDQVLGRADHLQVPFSLAPVRAETGAAGTSEGGQP